MEEKLKELLMKCVNNDISFWYCQSSGSVDIHKIDDGNYIIDEKGYIYDWEYEKPEEVLDRLHDAVDEFLEEGVNQ